MTSSTDRICPCSGLQNGGQEAGGESKCGHPENGRGMSGLGPLRELIHS